RGWTRGLGDPAAYLAVVEGRRAALEHAPEAAPAKLVQLVEAALLLPFEAGLAMERAIYEDLVHGAEARGLRHAFLAERRAARAVAEAGTEPLPQIATVAVLGQGAQAARIARACLSAGLQVQLAEADDPARLALRARIVADYAGDVQAGRLGSGERDRALAALDSKGGLGALAEATLLIATEGDPDSLAADLARAGAEAPPELPLALAVAGGDIAEAARAYGGTGRVTGFYLPAPAHETRAVELTLPPDAGPALAPVALALARALGKATVRSDAGVVGALTGALEGALFAAAEVLALTGVGIAEIDAAVRATGLSGPFERADAGRLRPVGAPGGDSRLRARMQDAGWTGRAAGQGFYSYGPEGAPPGEAPEARRLIGALREASRVPAALAPPDPDEIRRRCLLAMANAGARLVARGAVARPSDVDVAAVQGLGLARRLGGPMAQADEIGLMHARTLMRSWTGAGDLSMAVWDPAPLFDELIRAGERFESRNDSRNDGRVV
ncbi:MAG: hypothetical protein KDK28_03580, partial [Maritimibacter sp.]|nr:hypothetical protein [Maritimibacter sp.]